MPLHLAFCRPACRQHASYESIFSYTSKHAIIEAVIPASSGNEPLSMYSLHQKSISPMVVPLSVNLSSTAGTLNIRHHLPHTLESQSLVARETCRQQVNGRQGGSLIMLIYLHLSPAGRSHLAYFATCSMALGLVSSLNSLTAASHVKLSTVNAEGTCRLDEAGWMRFEGLFVNS